MENNPNDPLYGVTLETVLTFLVEEYGCRGAMSDEEVGSQQTYDPRNQGH
jgi:uncharacterized protein (DUF2132 family)